MTSATVQGRPPFRTAIHAAAHRLLLLEPRGSEVRNLRVILDMFVIFVTIVVHLDCNPFS